jgi:hypothetical protein
MYPSRIYVLALLENSPGITARAIAITLGWTRARAALR